MFVPFDFLDSMFPSFLSVNKSEGGEGGTCAEDLLISVVGFALAQGIADPACSRLWGRIARRP